MSAATVTSLAFTPLLRVARALGGDLERSVADAAGTLPDCASLQEHVPVERYLDCWSALEAALGREVAVDAVASRSDLADLEIFGFLAMTAADLDAAFARIAAVRVLWASGAGWSATRGTQSVTLRYHPWAVVHSGNDAASAYAVVEMLRSIRQIAGADLEPLALSMDHGSGAYSLTLNVGVGTRKALRFDDRLHDFFVRECEALVARRPAASDWLAQTTEALARAHAGAIPTAALVARQLAVSPRTLRRRLADNGTTFAQLRSSVALELTQACLARGLSTAETAFALGYAEPSAFFRAFKGWTGLTPRQFSDAPRRQQCRQ